MSVPATTTPGGSLQQELERQRDRLLHCVHCGFCLAACPTYNRLGDEADSPRGRLTLMRAVVDGRLDPAADAFQTHIDRCLGCRACEPVCPSGVEYGSLLELARDVGARARKGGMLNRLLLRVFASPRLRDAFFLGGRIARGTGIAALGARLLPSRGLLGSARLGLAMLASTGPWRRLRSVSADEEGAGAAGEVEGPAPKPGSRGRVALLTGCVQEGLYARVNAATARVLEANGWEVLPAAEQTCCGALHAHGGSLEEARALARLNVEAFEGVDAERIVVNAAGCGATMKDYGELLSGDPEYAKRAAALARRVCDVTELLVEAGPRPGAPVRCTVAYDHPCHLLHAQGVKTAPLEVLAAVPGATVHVVDNASECCGGAGIYGITHPELGGRIGGDKVAAVRAAGAAVVATPNPGCMMQIGAGLRLAGSGEGMVHPVELLDESYRRGGFYA